MNFHQFRLSVSRIGSDTVAIFADGVNRFVWMVIYVKELEMSLLSVDSSNQAELALRESENFFSDQLMIAEWRKIVSTNKLLKSVLGCVGFYNVRMLLKK